LSTPLLVKSELLGVLTLYSSNKDGFSAEHERVLEIVARQVAPVLKQARDFAAEKAQSHRDELTGLPNIEQFIQFSRSAQQTSGGVMAASALLLIDVDNLNHINHEFGRRTGDAVLNHVVDISRRVLRASDVLFRHEGDQFVVVLLHTTESTAVSLAEHLSSAISKPHSTLPFEVRVSISIAASPRDAATFEGLLEVAHRRLANRPPDPEPPSKTNNRIH